MGSLKAVYTLGELAQILGMSRWATRRWLDVNKIPYHQAKPGTGYRGSAIRLFVSDLKTYAPTIFTTIEETLEIQHNAKE